MRISAGQCRVAAAVLAPLVLVWLAVVWGQAGAAGGRATPDDDIAALKAKVAQATRMLAREGVIASSGHVSARIPGTTRAVIGAGNVSRDIMTAADVVTVDLDARQIEGTQNAPLETEMHTGIYRARPDVGAVIHTHPIHSVVFSVTRKPILPISVHGAIFADGVPTFEHVGHVNTRALGDALARVLGSRRAALIKMHGAVIVGSSLEEAFAASLQLEQNAEKQLWAEATGPVEPMTAEEVERSIRQSFAPGSIQKRWRYYQDKEAVALSGWPGSTAGRR